MDTTPDQPNQRRLITLKEAMDLARSGLREFVHGPGTVISPLAADHFAERGIPVRFSPDAHRARPKAPPRPAGRDREIIDISMPIRPDMPSYPGLPAPAVEKLMDIARGAPCNVSLAHLPTHLGTHVDSQRHDYPDGAGMEAVSLGGLVGDARVLDLTHVRGGIRRSDLATLDQTDPAEILLLKTANSTAMPTFERFVEHHIHIEPDAAEDILARGIRGLGIDCLSVERFGRPGRPTHKILLRDKNFAIIEGLDLRKVQPGRYWFACLPLLLDGVDGAPARAILIPD